MCLTDFIILLLQYMVALLLVILTEVSFFILATEYRHIVSMHTYIIYDNCNVVV